MINFGSKPFELYCTASRQKDKQTAVKTQPPSTYRGRGNNGQGAGGVANTAETNCTKTQHKNNDYQNKMEREKN